jgi:hypothetical protein
MGAERLSCLMFCVEIVSLMMTQHLATMIKTLGYISSNVFFSKTRETLMHGASDIFKYN